MIKIYAKEYELPFYSNYNERTICTITNDYAVNTGPQLNQINILKHKINILMLALRNENAGTIIHTLLKDELSPRTYMLHLIAYA